MTTSKRPNNPWQERFELTFEHPGVAPVAATCLVTVDTNANMADGNIVTINSGIRKIVYEYDKSANGIAVTSVGTAPPRAAWAAGAGTAAQSATTLATAIAAWQPEITVVDNADGTLTLTNRVLGTIGNNTNSCTSVGTLAITNFAGGVDAGSHNATYTKKLMTAQRGMKIDKVEYINPTGLTGHATLYWEVALKKGSTVIGQWSTDSDVVGEGTLTANTFVNLTLSTTAADLVAVTDDVISLALTKVSTAANLPAGRIVVHGRYTSL